MLISDARGEFGALCGSAVSEEMNRSRARETIAIVAFERTRPIKTATKRELRHVNAPGAQEQRCGAGVLLDDHAQRLRTRMRIAQLGCGERKRARVGNDASQREHAGDDEHPAMAD